jgi:hypothetical protein
MSDYTFPEKRFVDIGATIDEVTQLRREFNNSDTSIQRSLSEFWSPIPDTQLSDYLDNLRTSGHFVQSVVDTPEAYSGDAKKSSVTTTGGEQSTPDTIGDTDSIDEDVMGGSKSKK